MKKIIFLASVLIMLSAFPLNAQLPGDFNCSGSVNGLDMTHLMGYMHYNLVDTGTCTWYNGDLNRDSLYHTVADWRQLLRYLRGDTQPDNPPQPYYLDTLAVASADAQPGQTISLPIMIAIPETILDAMIQIQIDDTYLESWSVNGNPIYVGNRLYWWQIYDPDGLPAGQHLIGYFTLTISEDCPDDITIPITLIAGDYYPSGFANDSYPTYFIRPVLVDGAVHVSRTSVSEPGIPHDYDFGLKSFPNPFNASTVISYTLPQSGHVQLNIYNVLGRKVATLSDGVQGIGDHKIVWNAGSFPSGIYFARLRIGESGQIIRLALVK
jgi:hypothetical protein